MGPEKDAGAGPVQALEETSEAITREIIGTPEAARSCRASSSRVILRVWIRVRQMYLRTFLLQGRHDGSLQSFG